MDEPDIPPRFVQFYSTANYPCSYLPDAWARSQVAISGEHIGTHTFTQLIQNGFRRSGMIVYRPYCDLCDACIPVRVRVDEFIPNRTQRRVEKRLANLTVQLCPIEARAEHYALYHQYQRVRHPGGGMDEDNREQYQNFLLKSPVDSKMLEFRLGDRLLMVSVIDVLTDGWSAVYTFYDPNEPKASLGVYNILWQIAACRALELPYVYLGFWIEASPKMRYKSQYQPLEGLIDQVWQPISPDIR